MRGWLVGLGLTAAACAGPAVVARVPTAAPFADAPTVSGKPATAATPDTTPSADVVVSAVQVEVPPAELRFEAPVYSITIPAIHVQGAPLVAMNVRAGYLDLPNDPRLVAWYDFTSKPGMGGNAVLSAHVDYIRYGPAVFYGLARLGYGDEALLRLRDGTLLRYRVTDTRTVLLSNLDMGEVLAPTDNERLTLITCAGVWDGHDYSHRVVVIAERTGADPG